MTIEFMTGNTTNISTSGLSTVVAEIIIIFVFLVIIVVKKKHNTTIKSPHQDDPGQNSPADYSNSNRFGKKTSKAGKQAINYEKEAALIQENYTQTPMLTQTELEFYKQLQQALANYDIEIHYKIRLADIFRVSYQNKYFNTYFSKIKAKHADFVISEPETAEAVVVIELDDPSHDNPDSQKNDKFKNMLYAASAITLFRIKATEEYNFEYIKQALIRYSKTTYVTNTPENNI